MSKISNQLLSDLVKNNFGQFLSYFGVSLSSDTQKYFGTCPIHAAADNPTAFAFYKNSGVWKCFTHSCHDHFNKGSIGIIQALLSAKKRGWEHPSDTDKIISISQTLK